MQWTAIFTAGIAIICLSSALVAWFSAISARHATASVERRLRSAELRIESSAILMDSMTTELQRLANSTKMQKVRAATTHTDRPSGVDEPDPTKDPEAWRAWMNGKLRIMRSETK